ncbi:hypothetical protein [Nostoc sp. FACHB-190]|uniref:hypothetical protein n=1 Tax=Nostoc sp. FACHB-190 TaxID=2692838 RepID=UPI001688D441|nr:hypothetical protein [Nostoc sp. FACHB-190]
MKSNDSEYEISIVWDSVISKIRLAPARAFIGNVCTLVNFDGTSALVQCKSDWYNKIQHDLPIITTAFNDVFRRPITVSLCPEKPTNF